MYVFADAIASFLAVAIALVKSVLEAPIASAIYSTIVDDYITEFIPLIELREIWLQDLIEEAKKRKQLFY